MAYPAFFEEIMINLILAFIFGGSLGSGLVYLWLRGRLSLIDSELAHKAKALYEAQNNAERLRLSSESMQGELARLMSREAELSTQITLLKEQQAEREVQSKSLSNELKAQFSVLASEILQEKSEAMLRRNEEALTPLKDNIKRFEEQFQRAYAQEAKERYSLEKVIRELMDRSLQVSAETQSLTNALRGEKTKMQGDWGEMILENILEASGLRKDHEYFTQQTLVGEGGKTPRPDVIVKYPNGGFIIIDSKVSLTAYTKYIEAKNEEERQQAGAQHLSSVRKHIKELSDRSYQDLLEGSPDFVLLFMPNEPSYNLVMELDPKLWQEAYAKRIVLINGTNLIAALRMAQDMWQRDKQIKNVERIVDEAGKLYDQFTQYAQNLLDVERQFERASSSLQEARKRLTDGRGNIISRFEKLRLMGLKNKKSMPEALQGASDEIYELKE